MDVSGGGQVAALDMGSRGGRASVETGVGEVDVGVGVGVVAEGVGSSEIEPCQELCTTRRQEMHITAVSFDWRRETKPVQKPSRCTP